MNADGRVWILLLLALFSISCSRHVIRQSVREIDKPLFLPQKNWQAFLGMSLDLSMKDDLYQDAVERGYHLNKKTTLSPVIDLIWPSFHIGDKLEFYLPLILRAYLKKNVFVEDSIERINGTNIALECGISRIEYEDDRLRPSPCHLSLLIKKPIATRFWLESFSGLYIDELLFSSFKYNFDCHLNIPLTAGFQLTEQFSVKSSIVLNGLYRYYKTDPDDWGFYNWPFYRKGWEYSTKTYDLDIDIPLEFKYVFNPTWNITTRVGGYFYDNKNIYISGASWLTLTW
jgi:hypothetical protein